MSDLLTEHATRLLVGVVRDAVKESLVAREKWAGPLITELKSGSVKGDGFKHPIAVMGFVAVLSRAAIPPNRSPADPDEATLQNLTEAVMNRVKAKDTADALQILSAFDKYEDNDEDHVEYGLRPSMIRHHGPPDILFRITNDMTA